MGFRPVGLPSPERLVETAPPAPLCGYLVPVGEQPTAIVYIDGFNLYRRAIQGTAHKWLDIYRMSTLLLPQFEVQQVRYFTARVREQRHKPFSPQRQQAYLRALESNPKITVHYGKFRIDPREMQKHPLEYDADGLHVMVKVRKFEEKGSDVNLATHLLNDAFQERADAYVVMTNDSDLVEPLRLLRDEWQRTVGLITPGNSSSAALMATAPQIVLQLREGVLDASHLPDELTDSKGRIRRPLGW